jgi:hypothetical protein
MTKKRLYIIIIAIFGCLLITWGIIYLKESRKTTNTPTPTTIKTTEEQKAELKNDEMNFLKAQENKNLDPCLLIKDKQTQILCIQELAVATQDNSSCAVISNEDLRSNCSSLVFMEQAVASQKVVDCEKITDSMLLKNCVERLAQNNNQIDCNLIQDQTSKNGCFSIIYYQQAKQNNDFKLCDKIPELIQRANCLSEIQKIDLHSDNDKDGLDFLQEIVSNTNPNNKDTDADGHLDSEEVAKGFNPDGVGSLAITKPINLINCQDITEEEIKALCVLEIKDKTLDLFKCNDLNAGKLKDFCLKTASSIVK